MKHLFALLLLCCFFTAKSQDSIRYGRYFFGVSPSLFFHSMFGYQKPDVIVQFKAVSLQNPCVRYRAVVNRFYRENTSLLYVRRGEYQRQLDDYEGTVTSEGTTNHMMIGFGAERVIPLGRVVFIGGADFLIGTREEHELTALKDYSGPDSLENLYRAGVPDSYVSTLFTGLGPFAGFETEIGERLSLELSLRGLIGFNTVLDKMVSPYGNMRDVSSKPEATLGGLRFVLYYRF